MNCQARGLHGLVTGCSQFTTRCHHCGFAHFYKFNVEYIAQYPVLVE